LRPGDILRRRYRDRDNHATDRSGRFEVIGKVGTGAIKHNLLFGVDGYKFNDKRLQYAADPAGTIYGINLWHPVYGAPKPKKGDVPTTHYDEDQTAFGVYAQDQMDLGEHWKALIGVRYDRSEQTFHNLNKIGKPDEFIKQKPSATSPRVGLVYQPNEQWSFYVTSATSFRPNTGVSAPVNGVSHSFDPEEGKSYEIGAKWDTGRISSTLAVYQITKQNVLTSDPADPNNYNRAVGEMESKGVELDVAGQIAEGLRLYASYAYTDAQVTKDVAGVGGLSLVGTQNANVPKQSANLLLFKDMQIGGRKLSIGGGPRYVGEREGAAAAFSEADFFKLPAYTVWKAMASYEASDKLKLSLDVDNLFDKEHYVSSYSSYWVMPGTERRLVLTARIAF